MRYIMDITRLWRDGVKNDTTKVAAGACTYCKGTGRRTRYRCPVCDSDGYLSDILREDWLTNGRQLPDPLRGMIVQVPPFK